MRILVRPHASEIGGSQLNAVALARAVRDRSHEVLVACEPGPLVEHVRAAGLEHVALPPGRRRPSPAAAAELDQLVVRRGVDVVHGWEWPPVVDALATRLRRGTAVVGTVMSMSVVPFFPRCVPLLVGTEQIRDAALRAGHRRVGLLEPPVDIHEDHPRFPPGGFREEHALDPGAVLLAVICRLVPDLKLEGLLAACRAVGDLAARGRKVQLVIVGDGVSRSEVEEQARRANAVAGSRAVVLAGQLADPRPAYAAADVVLGHGGSALRGMAFGKPLVVLGEGGFSELLTPSTAPRFLRDGWYGVGPGSRGSGSDGLLRAIDLLLEEHTLRTEFGDFARRLVVKRFALDDAAGLLEDEYRLALQDRAPGERSDAARAVAGVLVHKFRRRAQRWRGTVRTDDANASPVLAAVGRSGES